jgi:hypothetical protein
MPDMMPIFRALLHYDSDQSGGRSFDQIQDPFNAAMSMMNSWLSVWVQKDLVIQRIFNNGYWNRA